jgi:hypothetical protein
MADRLLVGTRKGLFAFARDGGTWTTGAPQFLAQPVSMVLPDPRDGAVYVALALGHFGVKLHRGTRDLGGWTELPAPAFPKVDDADKEKAPSVELIWALESGGTDRAGLLWAGTIPGGLFRSADRGESWSLVESLWNRPERKEWNGGGYDHPGIHSICVDPRESDRLIVGVSTGGVWHSEDGAKSWRIGGKGLYAEYMPPDQRENPVAQDAHRVVQCPAAPDRLWLQHHNGVFVSRDRGANWQDVTTITPSKFGFAVAVHPRDPDTAWFAPAVKDECRVPVDGKMVVARTRDGAKSFETLRDGLPQRDAYDLVYRHGLAVDETGERLAMGSTTGHLWISEDGGARWTLVGANLPPIACVRFG